MTQTGLGRRQAMTLAAGEAFAKANPGFKLNVFSTSLREKDSQRRPNSFGAIFLFRPAK